jgi:hypothetical protein
MPKETIEITVCKTEWYLAGAQLVSTLAYPDQRDIRERSRFRHALIRWALEWRMRKDPNWRNELQLIRPAYFSGADRELDAIVRRGNKRFEERRVAAFFLAVPHFNAVQSGKSRPEQWHESLPPTVENMSMLAVDYLKLKEGSVSTFKSRIWAPSKPVIHAATAWLSWELKYSRSEERDPQVNERMAVMTMPECAAQIVAISEDLRGMLSHITQFKINESETVKFETVESQNSGAILQLPLSDPESVSFLFEGEENDEPSSPKSNA